jgi:hypothetical protein
MGLFREVWQENTSKSGFQGLISVDRILKLFIRSFVYIEKII